MRRRVRPGRDHPIDRRDPSGRAPLHLDLRLDVRVLRHDGPKRRIREPATEWLEGGQSSAPFALTSPAPPVDRLGTAWRYLTLGFTHIVPKGLDHMLFVLGIYLLSGRARSVLWQVSAFTVAHSITLGLSMYGVVAVSPRIVEPLIALSIAYVAIENIFLSELKSWRVALVFAFGLLHGMGFAGALKELGLPRSEFVTALLTFNVGVEAGQLAVIGAAFLLVGWHCANRDWYRSRIVVPVSMLIACTAVYWTIERSVTLRFGLRRRGLGKAEGRKRRAGTDKQDTTVTESKTKPTELSPMDTSSDVEARTCPQSRSQGSVKPPESICLSPELCATRFEHGNIGFLGALARLLVEGQTTASAEEHLQKLIDVRAIGKSDFFCTAP